MKYLVIGGTGTLGRATIDALLQEKSTEIVCFSRDELKQKEMKSEFASKKLSYVIGDIRDFQALDRAMAGVDVVFHFAAMKHVEVCESNPDEAIKTNLLGSINIADAAIKNHVKYCVLSSTDKAVDPLNTYGLGKALAEKIFFHRNTLQKQTSFAVYRWGNVIGSRGSVIQQFARDLIESKKVFVTHKDMTRFWIRIEDAVKFILSTYKIDSFSTDARIPPIKAASIIRVIRSIAEIVGISDYATVEIGIRPGEKLHEFLISQHEDSPGIDSAEAAQYSDSELNELFVDYLFNEAPDLLKNQELIMESTEVTH